MFATLNTKGWKHNTHGDHWLPKAKTIASLMLSEGLTLLALTGLAWTSDQDIQIFEQQLPPEILFVAASGFEPDRPLCTRGVALLVLNRPDCPVNRVLTLA